MSESKLEQIFFPYALKRRTAAEENNMRFVHYSSAEAAIKLITNREVWMRKARCMNDFSEIDYGMRCLRALSSVLRGTICGQHSTRCSPASSMKLPKPSMVGAHPSWRIPISPACLSITALKKTC